MPIHGAKTSTMLRLGMLLAFLTVLSFAPWTTHCVEAQVLRKELDELQGVGIVERRGEQVPPELTFKDSRGRDVRMGDLFDGARPVLLVMAYFDCPLLCTLVLNDVQRCLNEMNWTIGSQFRMVTVSFDHRDTPAMARAKQATYLAGYAKNVPEDAWQFLTGDVDNIRGLANAVGFHYRYIPENGEFSHSAALIVLSPEGKISNYVEKMVFPAAEVRQALMEAAEGRVGSIFERVAHFCFSYNFTTGKYSPRVVRIMQVGGAATLTGLAIFLGVVGLSRARHGHVALSAPGEAPDGAASERSKSEGDEVNA